MTTSDYIRSLFPEINEIKNEALAKQVANVWLLAMERGGWETIENIPFTLLIPDTKETLVDHTQRVTRMAMGVAAQRTDVDMDLVIAGGLLHDVGKLLEYEPVDGEGSVRKSPNGKLLRHPVSGAALALEAKVSDRLAHIIAAHSKEGEVLQRIPEAIIIHHCDFTDFQIEIAKAI